MSRKCRAIHAELIELLVAQERAIWRVLPNSRSDERHLVANTTGASGLDYHYNRNLLFWSDVKTRKIHSQLLKGISVILRMTCFNIGIHDPRIDTFLPLAITFNYSKENFLISWKINTSAFNY
jgi:hypothetical protein